jgi:hypothetical protein
LVFSLASPSETDIERFFFLGAVIAYCTYEVWAFTHGRTTTIDRFHHEPTPKNTNWRVLGLALDVCFSLGAAALLVRSGG